MQFGARIISGYKFIRGAPDSPFPKKSNNPGLNTMKFSYAIGCDYHLWIWTCLIPKPVVCLFETRHRNALTEKAWEDAIQELGKS